MVNWKIYDAVYVAKTEKYTTKIRICVQYAIVGILRAWRC